MARIYYMRALGSTRFAISLFLPGAVAIGACQRSEVPNNPSAGSGSAPATSSRTVTPETFIRAESNRYFSNGVKMAGGVNKFNFIRQLIPLDQQSIVRMNRDTLYGGAVVDTKGGATVTFPTIPDGRYASILVLDNEHCAPNGHLRACETQAAGANTVCDGCYPDPRSQLRRPGGPPAAKRAYPG